MTNIARPEAKVSVAPVLILPAPSKAAPSRTKLIRWKVRKARLSQRLPGKSRMRSRWRDIGSGRKSVGRLSKIQRPRDLAGVLPPALVVALAALRRAGFL